MRSKKAMIFENMSEVGIAVLIIIIAFLLMNLAQNMKKTAQVQKSGDFINQAINDNFIGLYLKAPVEVAEFEDQEMTMSDLIVLAAENRGLDYDDLWKQKTEEFFKKRDIEQIEVNVFSGAEKVLDASYGGGFLVALAGGVSSLKHSSSVYLPTHSGQALRLEIKFSELEFVNHYWGP